MATRDTYEQRPSGRKIIFFRRPAPSGPTKAQQSGHPWRRFRRGCYRLPLVPPASKQWIAAAGAAAAVATCAAREKATATSQGSWQQPMALSGRSKLSARFETVCEDSACYHWDIRLEQPAAIQVVEHLFKPCMQTACANINHNMYACERTAYARTALARNA
eukprot:3693298-Pleurochrysis_carterae.AAC.4